MKTSLIRLVLALTLACALGAVAGCASHPVCTTGKASHAAFEIKFEPDGAATPTGMIITPDDGDAMLQVVKSPGRGDNKVVWQSSRNFRIKFVQVDDPTQPLKPGKELGDESQGWNDAAKDHGVWQFTLNLRPGRGSARETVVAKYFVEHTDSGTVFDPVIIVGR